MLSIIIMFTVDTLDFDPSLYGFMYKCLIYVFHLNRSQPHYVIFSTITKYDVAGIIKRLRPLTKNRNGGPELHLEQRARV